ncbi:hypothetical protein [Luteirhabdus pelagi]|uniref:hypothetical protein n=1 Tax=Luteirhabdus pelagi TaxID=2792783 RepID=UPI00193A1C4E|nr:hypothetical protein [Luteirhabdus pelagi]
MSENFDITEDELKENLRKSTYPSTNKVEDIKFENLFRVPDNSQNKYATFSEEFEKYKLKVDIVKWLIGTVGLTLITFVINWGFKDRERGLIELQMYDRYANKTVVFHENPKNRLLLAQFYSNVSPSEKLRTGWVKYLKVVEEDYRIFKKEDSITKAELLKLKKEDTLNKSQIEEKQQLEIKNANIERIKAEPLMLDINNTYKKRNKIYLHIYNENQRDEINKIMNDLNLLGLNALGIELIENREVNNKNEIRYYFEEDIDLVNLIKSEIERNRNKKIEIKYIPSLQSKTSQGTIELWFM